MNKNYASFGRRWAALIIDGVIFNIVGLVIVIVLSLFAGPDSQSSPLSSSKVVAFGSVGALIYFAIYVGYLVYFIGSRGQTPGKMAMKIKVVNVGTQNHPDYLHAFLREIVGKFISSMLFSLGFLWMLWDKDKQTWHDKIAGTVVIKV